jgi:Leucine-rich repeat (LRR) protein
LSKIKNVTTLSLPPTTTDAQLAKVCGDHPHLTTLSVRYTNKVKTIFPIATLKSLDRLSLLFCGPVAVTPLTTMKQLSAFGMPKTSNPNASLAKVCQALTGIKQISLTGSRVTDLAPLSHLTELEVLHRGRMVRPKNLKLTNFSGVANLKNLQFIRLYKAGIEDLTPLSNLTNLLAISMTGCAAKDLTALSKLTNIEYLCFYGSKNLATLKGVENMKKLVRISLRGSGVTDLSALATTPLEYIYICDCNLIQSLDPLLKIKTLEDVGGFEQINLPKDMIKAFNAKWKAKRSVGSGQ